MSDGVELRGTPGKGRGVFVTRAFEAGERVLEGVIEQVVEANNVYANQLGPDRFAIQAGLQPYVNHSCDPSCGVRDNAGGGQDLVARRALAPGDEVTFDYAVQNLVIEHFPPRCRCGAARCRGQITGWRGLPPALKREYAPLVAGWLLELDAERA